MMDKDNCIKRGRDQLRIRLKSKGCSDESAHDLFKIPVEALYAEALREIGEQEAYIEELQNEIQSLKTENKFAYDVDFLIFCTDQVVCIEKNCYLYSETCAKE